MPSRLLTLMRKRGFNPLSLNPTLLALPKNSFSRTGGQFTAASSQYLSVASNTSLQIGSGVPFWCSLWCNPTAVSTGTSQMAVSKDGEFDIRLQDLSGNLQFTNTVNVGFPSVAISAGSWQHFLCYSDGAGTFGIIKNGGAATTASYNNSAAGTHPFQIGARSGANFYGGLLDNVLFGKFPTESFANIATALYNSGDGLAFQDITAQQQSDWGIVSGWLDNSLTADAFGSNTLTNNNGVTQAAGKVNAVAVDNDPVYFVNDASTNDNDLTQVTLASRPIYKTADGGYWTFDGTNDTMLGTWGISSASKIASFVVFDPVNATTNQIVVSSQGPAVQYQINANQKYFYAGINIYGYGANTNADKHIALSVFDGTQTGNANRLKGYINGGSNVITTFNGVVPSTLTSITMQFSLGAAPANGNLYHWSVFENLTLAQINAMGNYLATLHGLTWTDIT